MTVSDAAGIVYVVATPIGNLEDTSERALRILREVALIACEDTRRTARLCARFEIRTPRISLHAHNEARRVPGLLQRLAAGESIAVVSDAGTPLVSDPAARLVRAASDAGIPIVPVPGPSAVLAALVASALPVEPFAFFGFRPRRGRARELWLEQVAAFPGTVVLFEAPGRVGTTLRDLFERLGRRPVAVARELTKRHEQLLRGWLGEIEVSELRGEVTLVIGGPEASPSLPRPDARARAHELARRGLPTREAARLLAGETGLSQKAAYELMLRARDADAGG